MSVVAFRNPTPAPARADVPTIDDETREGTLAALDELAAAGRRYVEALDADRPNAKIVLDIWLSKFCQIGRDVAHQAKRAVKNREARARWLRGALGRTSGGHDG